MKEVAPQMHDHLRARAWRRVRIASPRGPGGGSAASQLCRRPHGQWGRTPHRASRTPPQLEQISREPAFTALVAEVHDLPTGSSRQHSKMFHPPCFPLPHFFASGSGAHFESEPVLSLLRGKLPGFFGSIARRLLHVAPPDDGGNGMIARRGGEWPGGIPRWESQRPGPLQAMLPGMSSTGIPP